MPLKLAVFLLLILLLLSSCDKKYESDANLSSDHLEFFGFTLIDVFWDDPQDDEVKSNYADEIADFCNLADLLVVTPEDDIVERLEYLDGLGLKAVIHMHELFFELSPDIEAPSGGDGYKLRDDFTSRIDRFISVNNLATNKTLIQCFYVGEEPTWNGVSFEEFEKATNYLKELIPDVPILLVEAYLALEDLIVPTSVDWVGFDHYFVQDPYNDQVYQDELALLKSKLSTDDQRLIIVLDTHHMYRWHRLFGGIRKSEMDEVALSYFDVAKSEEKVIGIIGYFWPSGFDLPKSTGARDMPKHVKETYVAIGRKILRR